MLTPLLYKLERTMLFPGLETVFHLLKKAALWIQEKPGVILHSTRQASAQFPLT